MDLSKMSGEALFYYFEHDHPNNDYASVVSLLPYALMDKQKAFHTLKRIVSENKKLVAVYPGVPGLYIDPAAMEYVGSIIDGALYICPCDNPV